MQALPAHATIYSLTDGNSLVQIDANHQAGMNAWVVNGQNQLQQQQFWYRIDNTGPQFSIDTLNLLNATPTGNNRLDLLYGNAQFTLDTVYTLAGGNPGDGNSGITETITIHNLTANPLPFHLFEFGHMPLNSPGVDVNLGPGGGSFNDVLVTSSTDPLNHFSELTTAPPALEGEAHNGPFTVNNLNTVPNYVLDGTTNSSGPATWALEWDASITNTFQVSKVLDLEGVPSAPEPGTLSLIGCGLLGLGMFARHRRNK